jgi:hypothetical protein
MITTTFRLYESIDVRISGEYEEVRTGEVRFVGPLTATDLDGNPFVLSPIEVQEAKDEILCLAQEEVDDYWNRFREPTADELREWVEGSTTLSFPPTSN